MIKKRAEAVIGTADICNNYKKIKSMAGNAKVIAVVKADAYGHGAAETAHLLEKQGCGIFAVASVEEALALRENGILSDILILGTTAPEYADIISKNRFIQTVNSAEYACALNNKNEKVRAHIKIDTGMSRLGLYCHDRTDIANAVQTVRYIHSLENIGCEGIFTHFARSDEPESDMTKKQFDLFNTLCNECMKNGISLGMRHCCNSAAIMAYPEMHLDAVRAGLVLYGLMPDGRDSALLTPAMTLVSRVSQVTKLKKGDTVSYGAAFVAEKDMTIAAVSIGYADGLPRFLSGRFSVLINGKECKSVGKICMDMCMFDVTDAECKSGDEVEVFGKKMSVNALAQVLGTINYELVCSVKGRVPRVYK